MGVRLTPSVRVILLFFLAAPSLVQAQGQDSSVATAKCRDGTLSAAVSRQGACSRHGGVAQWIIPAGATARCSDGSYSSSKQAQGTCANHGGVVEWFTRPGAGPVSPEEEQAYVSSMKSDLRNLVTAEEAYFADSVKYTTRIGFGGVTFTASAGNTLPRIALTADGWLASVSNAHTRTRCMIFIGSTPNPPAQNEGKPACASL